jgi:hypothetical protein
MNGEKYKEGDILMCIAGFTAEDGSGGAGYQNARVFKVKRITVNDKEPDKRIYWPTDGDSCGIYGRACKLNVREEEVINNYQIY